MTPPRIKSEFERVLEHVRWNHPCEKCGAGAGEPCHTASGNPTLTPHMYRFRRAHADAKAFMRNPRGAGRKPVPPEQKKHRVSVCLTTREKAYLQGLGDGNASKGVRKLIEEACKRTQYPD